MTTINSFSSDHVMAQLRDLQQQARSSASKSGMESSKEGSSFMDYLKENVNEVNQLQKASDNMATELATGKSQNLHETMIASTKAELSFNLLVQVRNKILEAYQEMMRMQV